MDKKGVFMGFMADLWGWGFFLIGVLFWTLFLFGYADRNVTSDISSLPYSGDDITILSYLKAPSNEGIVLDSVFLAYKYKDSSGLTSLRDNLNLVYGVAKPVCWKLWKYSGDDKELVIEEKCSETRELYDKDVVVPLPYNPLEKSAKVKLSVLGYKDEK